MGPCGHHSPPCWASCAAPDRFRRPGGDDPPDRPAVNACAWLRGKGKGVMRVDGCRQQDLGNSARRLGPAMPA